MKKQININDGLVELSLDEKCAICGGSAGFGFGRWLRRSYVSVRDYVGSDSFGRLCQNLGMAK